jgi:methionyl-tRNA formyltransferase
MEKIGLFATTEKGLAVLKKILSVYGSEVLSFVVVASDKNIVYDAASEIRKLAKKEGIPLYSRLSTPKEKANIVFAVSWRWLIPTGVTNKVVVFHDSILPRYRGFGPLVSALINGENRVGVTALLAVDQYDEGPILGQQSVSVTYPAKIAEVIQKIIVCYEKLAVLSIKKILSKNVVTRNQNQKNASYSLWRDDYDYEINWSWDAKKIRRFVDAVGFPYKGALTFISRKKVRLMDCEETGDFTIENRVPGKVIFIRDNQPFVVCGSGLLKITRLVDDGSGQNMLPLKKFRTRFGK